MNNNRKTKTTLKNKMLNNKIGLRCQVTSYLFDSEYNLDKGIKKRILDTQLGLCTDILGIEVYF